MARQRVKDVAVLDRRRQAVELRLAGLTYEEIAARLGYASKSSAWEAVTEHLKNQSQPLTREMVDLESARLDALLTAIWPKARKGELQSVDRALRISERRARLHGLDFADGLAERSVQMEEKQIGLVVLVLETFALALGHDPADPLVRTAARSALMQIEGAA